MYGLTTYFAWNVFGALITEHSEGINKSQADHKTSAPIA